MRRKSIWHKIYPEWNLKKITIYCFCTFFPLSVVVLLTKKEKLTLNHSSGFYLCPWFPRSPFDSLPALSMNHCEVQNIEITTHFSCSLLSYFKADFIEFFTVIGYFSCSPEHVYFIVNKYLLKYKHSFDSHRKLKSRVEINSSLISGTKM